MVLKDLDKRLDAFLKNTIVIEEKEGIDKVLNLLGVSQRSLSAWRKGERKPLSKDFEKYETVLAEHLANAGTSVEPMDGYSGDADDAFPGVVLQVPVSSIDPNPYQPRQHYDSEKMDELKNSIAANGLMQPPVVRMVGDRYELVAGERRLRAVKSLGHETIPVLLAELSDQQVATMALVENMQREDVSPMSTARAVKRMNEEFGLSQSQIAEKLGVTQAKVSQYLSLTKLIEPYVKLIESGELSQSVGRIVAGLAPEQQQLFESRIKHLTAKDAQGIVNFINRVEKLRAGLDLEIRNADSLHDKLLKYLVINDAVDWYHGIYWQGSRSSDFTSFYVSQFSFSGLKPGDRRNEKFFSILNRSAREHMKNGRMVDVKADNQQKLLSKFLDEYFDFKIDAAAKANKTANKDNDEQVPRETKEEREHRIKEIEVSSPVPVIDFNKGKTKAERLMKRLQEKQGDPINDRSTLCVNCSFFNPDGQTYKERCGAEYGFNIHSVYRYKIEGEADVFICNSYSPKPEHVEKMKAPGMDIESSMLKLLLDILSFRISSVERLIPDLKGMDVQGMVKYFTEADDQTKAYFLHVVSVVVGNYQYGDVNYILDPDGKVTNVEQTSIIGSDDI